MSLFVSAVLALVISTQGTVESVDDSIFYQAYYLETEAGDFDGALTLYQAAAKSASLSEDLRTRAIARAQGCQEEIAARDLASLFPVNTILYAELSEPGEQLKSLASQLGLLRTGETGPGELGVSPALLEGILGIRGVAVGLSGVDFGGQTPRGVLIAHPGEVNVVRGLIETALPAAAAPSDSIEGFDTYLVEDHVYVTLTHKLVIVSPQAASIKSVIRRLRDPDSPCLADNADLAASLKARDPSLISFVLDFKRLMPVVMPLIASQAGRNPELSLALASLDLNSLNHAHGHLGVQENGLCLEVGIQLESGHHNLVYDLFRFPALDRSCLERVPAGAAAVIAASLNPKRDLGPTDPAEQNYVSLWDLGREIFGNIVSVALFAMPVEGEMIAGEPVPGIAAVMTVNDPAKTNALWSEFLGLASAAASPGASIHGETMEVAGVQASKFSLPEGVVMYTAVAGDQFIITPSPAALASCLETLRGGPSLMDDPAFAPSLAAMKEGTTLALQFHPRRLIEIGRPHMGRDYREIAPFLPALERTVGALMFQHSAEQLSFSLRITSLPNMGPILTDLVKGRGQAAERQVQVSEF